MFRRLFSFTLYRTVCQYLWLWHNWKHTENRESSTQKKILSIFIKHELHLWHFPLLLLLLLLEINKMKILTLEHWISVAFACVHNGLFIGWMPHLDVIVSFYYLKAYCWMDNEQWRGKKSEKDTEQASQTADIFKRDVFFCWLRKQHSASKCNAFSSTWCSTKLVDKTDFSCCCKLFPANEFTILSTIRRVLPLFSCQTITWIFFPDCRCQEW